MSNPKEPAPPELKSAEAIAEQQASPNLISPATSAPIEVAVTGGIPILAIVTPTESIERYSGERLAKLILDAYSAHGCTIELQ